MWCIVPLGSSCQLINVYLCVMLPCPSSQIMFHGFPTPEDVLVGGFSQGRLNISLLQFPLVPKCSMDTNVKWAYAYVEVTTRISCWPSKFLKLLIRVSNFERHMSLSMFLSSNMSWTRTTLKQRFPLVMPVQFYNPVSMAFRFLFLCPSHPT